MNLVQAELNARRIFLLKTAIAYFEEDGDTYLQLFNKALIPQKMITEGIELLDHFTRMIILQKSAIVQLFDETGTATLIRGARGWPEAIDSSMERTLEVLVEVLEKGHDTVLEKEKDASA